MLKAVTETINYPEIDYLVDHGGQRVKSVLSLRIILVILPTVYNKTSVNVKKINSLSGGELFQFLIT